MPAAVVSELPIFKIYTPLPLKVIVPVIAADEGKQNTPGESVCPPMSAASDSWVLHIALDRDLYVEAASVRACATNEFVVYVVPVTLPGGKPVIAVPGLIPIFPTMVVLPVLVIVEAPKTAKLVAAPICGCVVVNPYFRFLVSECNESVPMFGNVAAKA